jgi:hypothetical protein
MASRSPPRQQTPLIIESPVHTKKVHSNPSYQSDILEDARLAVLQELGSYAPKIPFQTFLDYLAPPQPEFNLNTTMRSLKSGSKPVLTSSNRWSKFAKAPTDSQGSEDSIFSPIPEIFTKVVAAIVANSGGNLKEDNRTVDFLQNPSQTPISADRRNESRPDGYLVLKDRTKKLAKDGRKEDILWADIALSCEYKRKDGVDDLDDVRIHRGPFISRGRLISHIRTCESACGACNTSCEMILVAEPRLASPSKIPRQEYGSAAALPSSSASHSILSMCVFCFKNLSVKSLQVDS